MNYFQRSWREFWLGVTCFDIWLNLSIVDVISRYRRTFLGPLWHVLSHAATIIGLSLLYSKVLHQDAKTYLLYVSAGLTVWSLMVLPFVDAANIMVRAKPLILAYDTPISMHVMRAVSGYFLIFLHNMLVYVAVLIFAGCPLNLNSFLFLPALGVILLAATGLSFILSFFGARYRDLGPATTMVTSIAFLLTPVFWNKTQALGVEWFTNINPFYHFLEIARAPMLGLAPNPLNWSVSISVAVVLFATGVYTVVSNRSNITYWV